MKIVFIAINYHQRTKIHWFFVVVNVRNVEIKKTLQPFYQLDIISNKNQKFLGPVRSGFSFGPRVRSDFFPKPEICKNVKPETSPLIDKSGLVSGYIYLFDK